MQDTDTTISSDPAQMDVAMIHQFLKTSYWGASRTYEQVQTSIDNSTPFGLFLNNQQIAFARVISDKIAFAYLMDVFVLNEYRSKGYAQKLLSHILSHPDYDSVSSWTLKTQDAHYLYEKFGFESIKDAEQWMTSSNNN